MGLLPTLRKPKRKQDASLSHLHKGILILMLFLMYRYLGTFSSQDEKFIRNSERSYVYLEVAIDGIHIGRVTAELYDDIVPRTAKNFRKLVTGEMGQQLSYANSTCHRIIKDFIVQCLLHFLYVR